MLISSQGEGWRGGQPSHDWERGREDGKRDRQRGRGRDKMTEAETEAQGGIKRLRRDRKMERWGGTE